MLLALADTIAQLFLKLYPINIEFILMGSYEKNDEADVINYFGILLKGFVLK